jgi:hypothetical protein
MLLPLFGTLLKATAEELIAEGKQAMKMSRLT